MKKSLYIAISALVAGGLLSACSSNYLDVKPETDIDMSQLSDPAAAKTLVAGIYEAMNVQYSALSINDNVGESTVNLVCSEACGVDYTSGLWNALSGLRSWAYINNKTAYPAILPWMYYYNIINLSNYLIQAIPGTAEDPGESVNEVLLYKAEAYTMRAHAYTKLLGFYGNRWEDSDEGETYCIVIRTEPGVADTPLRTMNEVLDLIYADLEEACKLYDASGLDRSATYEANKSVALGIWARAALIKHDWQTAADKAKEARQGYTIMSQNDLFSGFFTENSETMWCMQPTDNTTYYWSWGAHYSCNGAYTQAWEMGAGAINIDLYNAAKQISPNDLRLKFFWTPDKLAEVPRTFNPANLTEKDFWNPKMVQRDNFLNMSATNVYDRTGRDTLGYGMINALAYWLWDYSENTLTCDRSLIQNDDRYYNYYTLDYKGNKVDKAVRLGKDAAGQNIWALLISCPFGAQNKFWSMAPYGAMAFPWMRASEMALTEAEAQYQLGNYPAALEALNEVQSKRIPGYKSNKSGEALLNEIKVCRRIELWGEGFNFLDFKRWNEPRVRRIWIANDPTSGNCIPDEQAGMTPADVQRVQSTKYSNGWRFVLPARETDYNEAIKLELLKTIAND